MLSVFREDGLLLVHDVEWGSGSWRRTRGLIGKAGLDSGRGLVLAPCRAIHTCFMRFPLDVIFFSRDGRVIRTSARVPPFRIVWGGWPARGVLEMQAGWFPWSSLRQGDRLVFKKNSFPCNANSIE